ncbi:hypothetical protein Tco_1469988 [Tanacetum coccineum]
MSRKGLKFSGRITPLFSTMLASAEVEEGEGSEQPTESQPPPSPTQPSVRDQPHVTESSSGPDNTHIPSMNLEGTGGNEGDQIQRISLTGFLAQSVGSSNTDVLDSPCLLVLITGMSQSRQHGKSEPDSYYLSNLDVNSFTGPESISS